MLESIRKKYQSQDYFKKCALTGIRASESHSIQWHHAWQYQGKQVDELIVPLLDEYHMPVGLGGNKNSVHSNNRTKEWAKYESLRRWLEIHGDFTALYKKYPKKNWRLEYQRLQLEHSNHKI